MDVPTASQIISKNRVSEHGEVLTNKREVNAMLGLIQRETDRIESRFLEPACGTGNFLEEILERKLSAVDKRYAKSQVVWERYAVLAVSSIYGIDILQDNVQHCRERLLETFKARYEGRFSTSTKSRCVDAVKFILRCNIIRGDTLAQRTVGARPTHIILSEWSLINGGLLKRRTFTFCGLLARDEAREPTIASDLAENISIPSPDKEFTPVHFLELANAQ
jgi:hypothetical protein